MLLCLGVLLVGSAPWLRYPPRSITAWNSGLSVVTRWVVRRMLLFTTFLLLLTLIHVLPLALIRVLLPLAVTLPTLFNWTLTTQSWFTLVIATFGILLIALPQPQPTYALHTVRRHLLLALLILLPLLPTTSCYVWSDAVFTTLPLIVTPLMLLLLTATLVLVASTHITPWPADVHNTFYPTTQLIRVGLPTAPRLYITITLVFLYTTTSQFTPVWLLVLLVVTSYTVLLLFLTHGLDNRYRHLMLWTTFLIASLLSGYRYILDTWLLTLLYVLLLEQHSYFMYRLVRDEYSIAGYLAIQLALSYLLYATWYTTPDFFVVALLLKLGFAVIATWTQFLYAEVELPLLFVYITQAYLLITLLMLVFRCLYLDTPALSLLLAFFLVFVGYVAYTPTAHFNDHYQPIPKYLTMSLAATVFIAVLSLLVHDYTTLVSYAVISVWTFPLLFQLWLTVTPSFTRTLQTRPTNC